MHRAFTKVREKQPKLVRSKYSVIASSPSPLVIVSKKNFDSTIFRFDSVINYPNLLYKMRSYFDAYSTRERNNTTPLGIKGKYYSARRKSTVEVISSPSLLETTARKLVYYNFSPTKTTVEKNSYQNWPRTITKRNFLYTHSSLKFTSRSVCSPLTHFRV